MEEASGYEGSEMTVALDDTATQRVVSALDSMVERRLAGEPLQYVLGRWAFRTLDLMVDRRVLIPRPETEVVAGCAIGEVDRARERGAEPVVVVDLGTGSGAIALSVADERERSEVWASEVSADALAVARANLAGVGRAATRVRLVQGSWFEPLPPELLGAVHVVVSNPPYVSSSEELPAEVLDWEPAGALFAGARGTEALEHIISEAPRWLAPGGSVVLEMAPHQAPEVSALASKAGFASVEVVDDLAGRSRVLLARDHRPAL